MEAQLSPFSNGLHVAINDFEYRHGLKATTIRTESTFEWTRNQTHTTALSLCAEMNIVIKQEKAKYAIHLFAGTQKLGRLCYFGNVKEGHRSPPRAIIVKQYENSLFAFVAWKKECFPIRVSFTNEGVLVNAQMAYPALKGTFKAESPKSQIVSDLKVEKFHIYPEACKKEIIVAVDTVKRFCIIAETNSNSGINSSIYVYDKQAKKWTKRKWTSRRGRMTAQEFYDAKDRPILRFGCSGWSFFDRTIKRLPQEEWSDWNIEVSNFPPKLER